MVLKTIIVDDESGCREVLNNLLSKFCPNVEIVSKAASASAAYEAILQHKPDLVFLDIEMPQGNSFDLLERFSEIDFDIIFTTAYDHYAIKAIKFSAIDYLLKPVDPDDLKQAVGRLLNKKENQQLLQDKFKTLLDNIKPGNKPKKVAIADGEGLIFVNIKEIIRCDSDGNYTYIILENGKKMMASRTLGEYEEMFAGENFFRVHRSHLINMDHIKKYIKGEGGYVILSDNSQAEVSRRKKIEFLEKLSQV